MGPEPTTPTRFPAVVPLTPASTPRSPQQLSPAPTLVESSPPPSPRTDKLAAAFAIHDYIVRQGPPDLDVPFPFFATIGGQSAGKSSVLSALLNVVLWSSSGTATHGPTLIHSCHRLGGGFEASIEIQITAPQPGCPKRVAFTTSPIESRGALEQAMRWAGDEARRAGRNGAFKIRSFDDLKEISDSERQRDAGEWPRFTTNEVRLTISGPQQKDVSIVDLPGLHGNDETVYGLAETYISKPECIVILCIPAGGKDPSNVEPEVGLVQKHRPNGKGVMGIITKADNIGPDCGDPYRKLIEGISTDMGDFTPEHGWSPLRLRTSTERAKSDDEVHMIQARLFAQPHWTSLAKKTSRAFGIDATARLLCSINESAVLKNFKLIRDHLQELKLKNKERLHELPAELTDPVGTTHDIIYEISERLHARFLRQSVGSDGLYELQKNLVVKLGQIIPRFVPFIEKDVSQSELYNELLLPDVWLSETRGKDIYLDSVIDAVQKNTQKRNGKCDFDAVRMSFAGMCTQEWRTMCLANVNAVWEHVTKGIEGTVSEVCGESKPELASRMKSILREKQQCFRDQILELTNSLCDTESEDPWLIDVGEGKIGLSIDNAVKHFTKEYGKIYHRPTSAPSTPTSSTSEAASDRPSPPMSDRDGKIVFQVMANVTVFLVCGATRLGNVVGRETQVRVVRYLRQTASALRKGLELDELQEVRFQKTRKLHDPDPEVAHERDELAKRQKQLDEFEETLRRV